MTKKIMYAMADMFDDEDVVKYASGVRPKASTNRRYSVTIAERRLLHLWLHLHTARNVPEH